MTGLVHGGLPVRKWKKLLQITFIFCLVFFSNRTLYSQHIARDSTQIQKAEKQDEAHPGSGSHWFAGAKVGLIYLFGLELQYNLTTKGVSRMYLAAAVQSSVVVNSANIGGGVFLGNTGLGIGCRFHQLLWFESEKESNIQPGYGPEIIWNKKIGAKNLVNLHAGGIITEGAFFPDISFGVLIPIK